MAKPRKVLISLLTVALLVSLTGGLTQVFAQQEKIGLGDISVNPQKSVKDMYFRLVTHGGDDPFWAVVQKGMRDAEKQLGCRADIDLCGGDLALQKKRFREAVAMGVDGIALVINDATAWDEPVRDAIQQGVNVIGMNNDDPEGAAGNPRFCYVGQNERRAGRIIAERLFKTAKEKGINLSGAHVAMFVEVPGASYGVIRSNGVKDMMEEYGITSFEIVDCGGLESSTVQSRETSYLLAHPETNFAIGLGGICTDRLMASLKGAGYNPGEIIAGGFDTTPGTLSGIRQDYVEATIDQQQYLQGYFAVYVLYLMKKYGFAPNIDTGGYLVDEGTIGVMEKLSPEHIR